MDANIISKRYSVDTYGVRNNKCPLAITFSESFLSPRFNNNNAGISFKEKDVPF